MPAPMARHTPEMESRSTVDRPVVLSVGGLDPTATVGVLLDVATCGCLDVHCAAALTVVTAQDTVGIHAAEPVDAALVAHQVALVLNDLDVVAAKTAMLWDADIASQVADQFVARDLQRVVDPVLVDGRGQRILPVTVDEVLKQRLVPGCWFITPNRAEAELLLSMQIETDDDALAAADALVAMGANSAVVTGGAGDGREVVDATSGAVGRRLHRRVRVEGGNIRGSGDVLSAALSAAAVLGLGPEAAYEFAAELALRSVANGVGRALGAGRHSVEVRRGDADELRSRLPLEP